jgi:hypothetical protein
MTGVWVKQNGIRFKKWAELYVLIKAIAGSWQPLIDIFKTADSQCGVCRNERYNAQYFKYKLLSSILPSLPIIRFPRWPNIVLDLSDVRFGIAISVPNFQFRLNPIRLPALPSLSLPRIPRLGFSLPSIPSLPPIPRLPDLPNLPSLPKVQLPNLPPPQKLPKLFGAVASFAKIMKLIAKMKCYYANTVLVPEWNV